VFCCFGQPDLRADFTLAVTSPAGWECVADGAVTGRPATGQAGNWRFATVPSMKPYDMALCAGPQRARGERRRRLARLLYPATLADPKTIAASDAALDRDDLAARSARLCSSSARSSCRCWRAAHGNTMRARRAARVDYEIEIANREDLPVPCCSGQFANIALYVAAISALERRRS
jgi:hypothetical protein